MLSTLRAILIRWLGGNNDLPGRQNKDAESVEMHQVVNLEVEEKKNRTLSLNSALLIEEKKIHDHVVEVHPEYLNEVVLKILQTDDIYDSIDRMISENAIHPVDVASLYVLLSDYFGSKEDKLTAVNFLNMARDTCNEDYKKIHELLTKKYIALRHSVDAFDIIVNLFLSENLPDLNEQEKKSVRDSYGDMKNIFQSKVAHGHDLLISYCRKNWIELSSNVSDRELVLIEIGSTRENVPGQGSSRIIANFCKEKHINFISVDMDPHNTTMAQKLFLSLKTNFKAINMKGEDYLRGFEGAMDFVFLDAYDFDHGKHSALRQSRYEKYLGSNINDTECHRMHLDCAQSVAKKLSPHGLICVDDTWLENGCWTAKGTLAMPYLLANGFEVLEARNRAALLARVPR
jgi:hypothetical protein